MTAPKQQWRVVMTTPVGRSFTVWVDAVDESGARAFAVAAFPTAAVFSVKLEPANPCPQYARREAP